MMASARIMPGTEVEVLVDPDDDRRVEIDWDGPILEPSLEDRAASDPLLQAFVDRRVDPPTET